MVDKTLHRKLKIEQHELNIKFRCCINLTEFQGEPKNGTNRQDTLVKQPLVCHKNQA